METDGAVCCPATENRSATMHSDPTKYSYAHSAGPALNPKSLEITSAAHNQGVNHGLNDTTWLNKLEALENYKHLRLYSRRKDAPEEFKMEKEARQRKSLKDLLKPKGEGMPREVQAVKKGGLMKAKKKKTKKSKTAGRLAKRGYGAAKK